MKKNIDFDKHINILHMIGSMDRGGAETFLMNVLRTIDRDRFHFVFLCFGDDPFDYEQEAARLGATIRRIAPISIKDRLFKNVTDIMKIIKEEKIDILHAHIYHDSVFSVIASMLAGVKLRIVHSHATLLHIKPSFLSRLYYFSCTTIIRLLSTMRVACGTEAGISLFGSSRFTVLHNGVILDDFYFSQSSRDQIRKDLAVPIDATVIGHVGRMDELKNQAFAISVFSEYLAINNNAYLLLVGDGELRQSCEQQTKDLGVSKRVKFLGKQDDVGSLYSAMDLFIFPSLHEGLGMVLVEAQANGLKSLVSDTVPKAVKLTDMIEFMSLSLPHKIWANKIGAIKLSRKNNSRLLENSTYNMKVGVRVIEKLYIGGLVI